MRPGIRRSWHSLVFGAMCIPIFGCGPSRPLPFPPTPTGSFNVSIQGITRDAAMQPLAGVTIEVASGVMAGLSVMSQANGASTIEMTGVTGDVVLRSTKDGYAPAVSTVAQRSIGSRSEVAVSISLRAAVVPGVVSPGEYSVTMESDCPDFPEDLRTRSYAATLTLVDGILSVTLKSPFLEWGGFSLEVSGNFVFLNNGMGIYETLPDHTYWRFTAFAETGAETVVDGPSNSVVLVPFSGAVEYCVLKSAASAGKFCSARPEEILVHRECTSDKHKLIFDRR